jgi:hypothetical protein
MSLKLATRLKPHYTSQKLYCATYYHHELSSLTQGRRQEKPHFSHCTYSLSRKVSIALFPTFGLPQPKHLSQPLSGNEQSVLDMHQAN